MTNPLNTDIVVLLREYEPYNELHGQAADEIERLRNLVAEYRNLYLLRSRLEDQLEATDRR